MALSKVNPNLVSNGGSRSNIIINGGMQAWQRATSASAIGYTSVDRWSYYSGSSLAISRSTDVPTGFQYATSVGGGGSDSGLTQKIEASSCKQLVGATITVSFYLKQTTGAGTDKIAVALARANSEDNFGGTTSISTQTVSTTTSYARYTCTFTSLPTEVSNGLQLSIKSNGAGSVVYLITGVQLELGSVATDFEHRSYQEELLLCEWYFKKWLRSDPRMYDGLSATYTGIAKATNEAFFYMPFNMRATPTSAYSNIAVHDGVGGVINAVGSSARSALGSFRLIFSSGLTAGDILYIRWTSSTSYISFDAEL